MDKPWRKAQRDVRGTVKTLLTSSVSSLWACRVALVGSSPSTVTTATLELVLLTAAEKCMPYGEASLLLPVYPASS